MSNRWQGTAAPRGEDYDARCHALRLAYYRQREAAKRRAVPRG